MKKQWGLYPILASVLLLLVAMPVSAWSDIGVDYYNGFEIHYGDWDDTNNEAEEEYFGFFSFYMCVTFNYTNVDQDADVYKIRLDFNGGTGSERINLWYRWGDSGSFTLARIFGPNAEDFYVTISDASNALLQIRFWDYCHALDSEADTWYFGGEPELWLYWY